MGLFNFQGNFGFRFNQSSILIFIAIAYPTSNNLTICFFKNKLVFDFLSHLM